MHVSVGAAILIVGLLWLATPAARKVLGLVLGLGLVVVVVELYHDHQTALAQQECEAKAAKAGGTYLDCTLR